jgi:antitoxin (DNA-binding transcriptional repressor) of toxin-antitoxin stability system
MKASFLDLRRHMSRILRALDRNEEVVLTYRGQEKATIVPRRQEEKRETKSHPAFGLWAGRKDMEDVDQTVRQLRKGRMNAV